MRLLPQTAEWFDRLATLQQGYYYPWHSHIAAWNGESVYWAMVREHLHPGLDVLDVACGHGEPALNIAPSCRSVLGYDRTEAWITLAQQTALERGLANISFVCHDSSPAANKGHAHIPAADASYDLLLCSKGPFHWIEDAPRVARAGAVLLMLVPDATPLTAWHALLPLSLQWQASTDPYWARPAIEQQLMAAGLELGSWWSFDVPEVFAEPKQLYRWLSWGTTPDEVASFGEVRPLLDHIFAEYGDAAGIAVRRRRYVWKAVVPRP